MPFQNRTKDNLARLGDEDKKEILEQVLSEIDHSEKRLSIWKKNLVTYYELYTLVQKHKNYAGLAQVFVPEVLRAVETVASKLYQIVFGQPNFFEYTGRTQDEDGPALAQTQLTAYQMDENGFKQRTMDSFRQLAVTGLTIRKVMWDYQEVGRTMFDYTPREYKDPLTGKTMTEKVREKATTFDTLKDTWTFEPVDLLGFHISDVTTPYNDLQKARWVAEQYKTDKTWLREKVRRGWLDDSMKSELSTGSDKAMPSSEAENLRKDKNNASGYKFDLDAHDGYEVIERWGLVDAEWVYDAKELEKMNLEPEDQVEGVIIIVNKKAIYKCEANPFWHNQKPYVGCPFVAKEGEFAGIGVAQIAEKLQEELNDTRNQTMDNKTMILSNMWLKHRASGIKNSDLRIRPTGVIQTNDMKGLEPLRPPVLTGVGVNIEGVIKEDLRESVGAASNLQGIAQSGVNTATEASAINRESLSRLVMVAEMYGDLVLKPTLVMAEYLNYQFYDHTKVIKIIGAVGVKFRKIAPEDLTGYKDVVIHISTDAMDNPGVKRQQMMTFFSLIQQMMPQQIEFHWKMLDKMYHMFFNGRSLSEIYPAPASAEEKLTPDEEIDLVLAEHLVKPQEGVDFMQHIKILEKAHKDMKFALSEFSLEILQSLILGYHNLLTQQIQAQNAQMIQERAMQAMQMQQAAQGGKKPNMGQQANGSPSTISADPGTPSVGGLRQEQGV